MILVNTLAFKNYEWAKIELRTNKITLSPIFLFTESSLKEEGEELGRARRKELSKIKSTKLV